MTSTALSKRLKVSDSYLKNSKSISKRVIWYIQQLVKMEDLHLEKTQRYYFYDVFLAIEGRGNIFSSQHLLTNFLEKRRTQSTTM